jgi:hypothetical protein
MKARETIEINKIVFRNYWFFGFCPFSGIVRTREHTVWKLDLFESSDEGGDTYSVGSLRKS